MKKITSFFFIALFVSCFCALENSAHANTFAVSDWEEIKALEKTSLKLGQNIIQSDRALIVQHDYEQLSCLDELNAPLAHVQDMIGQEKGLLELSTLMTNQVDEKKVKIVLQLNITSDLGLLEGYRAQAHSVVDSCPNSALAIHYAEKVNDLATNTDSALRSIQQRLPHL